jgi:hypothetical protein
MKLTHPIVRTLITFVISGCGVGSGLTGFGISGGNGGGNNSVAPVLSFFTQPSTTNVDQIISPPIQVLAKDSLGAPDSAFTGTITVTLTSNSTGAGLSGTTSVRPVNGIATFSNLAIDKAGTYTLTASTSGSIDATSSPFPVTTITGP